MCSEEKLLSILEDLRIEYTPFYTHYYHMLVALKQEYGDKPSLCKKLKERISEKLDKKTIEI